MPPRWYPPLSCVNVIVSYKLLSPSRVPAQLTIYANRISLMFKTEGQELQKFDLSDFYLQVFPNLDTLLVIGTGRHSQWNVSTWFRRNKDPNELWKLVQPLLQGKDSSDVPVPKNLVPGFVEGWFETIEKDKPDYVSRDTFLRVRESVTLGQSQIKKIQSTATLGHKFSKIDLKKNLRSEQRRNEQQPVTVKVVRGGWKKLVYGNGDEEWDPV